MQHSKTRGGTTGAAVKLKASGPNRSSGTRIPRLVDRRSQNPHEPEKKRVGRASEWEAQLARLQEELEKTKHQLRESESSKEQVHEEAEDAKKQLAAISAELEESRQQLDEIWACEESRIRELRKVSQDRDRVWESELKAVQKHHAMDSAALAAALNENQKLKIQLQKMIESEETGDREKHDDDDDVQGLRLELSETLDLIEELKIQLNESRESEARALELVSRTQEQLEMVKSSMVVMDNSTEGVNGVEELGSALAANAEMEGELRRLKVQTEQWRKAAEMATAMVLGEGGGGKFVENPVSVFDIHVVGEKLNSPYSEDAEDESSMKKTSNMLKKLGVLLKKGQK